MQVGGWVRVHEDDIVTWRICSDLSLLLKHKEVTSDTFEFGDDNRSIFRLKLCKGSTPDDCRNSPKHKDVWRLKLCCIDVKNSSITWNYKISIFKNAEMLHTRIHNCKFSTNQSEELIFIMFSDEIDQFIPRTDYLKISCHLEYIKKNSHNFVKDASTEKMDDLGSTFNNEWIFLNENLSDVKLRTACGKEIPAHRVLLANASPVFKAMFSHDMLENNNKLVNITDVGYSAAVEMLRYIYTGSVETQEFSFTTEVLAAADKYQLIGLKNKCERILSSNLSIENTVEALRIADMYSAKRLKEEAVAFVRLIINGTLDCDKISDMILDKAKLASK